jgi:hypothetical protein
MPGSRGRIEEKAEVPWWLAWLETGLLSAALPVGATLAGAADPFFCRAPFCWPLLGPLLAGLRYGFLHGVAAAAALLAFMRALDGAHLSGQLAIAILLVAMLTGELSDHWRRRVLRAERIASQVTRRTNGFIRAYHAMTASHDRLTHRLQSADGSLREALSGLSRRLSTGVIGTAERDEIRSMILELFMEFANVRIASFHAVDCREQPQPATVSLGDLRTDPCHPMISESVRRREVISVRPDGGGAARGGPLVVVPLVTAENEVLACISIVDMPFVSLNKEVLQLLAVLGGRVADLLKDYQRPDPVTDEKRFLQALRRSILDRQQYQLASAMVVVSVGMPDSARVMAESSTERRATDNSWLTVDVEGEPVLVMLLTLTGMEGATSFAQRMEGVVRARYGGLLPDSCVRVRIREIGSRDSVDNLLSFAHAPVNPDESEHVKAREEEQKSTLQAPVRRRPPAGNASAEAT